MINKVKIGCLEYSVIETDEPLIINGKADYNGIVNYESLVIKIKKDMAEQAKNLVLWHEMMHAIEKQYNLELGDNAENIIESFSNGVYQLLQDNVNLPGCDDELQLNNIPDETCKPVALYNIKLTTEQITKLWQLCYDNRVEYYTLFGILENMRPAGGFGNDSA